MRKSKKGITLVEMVIACVIMVLLGGACTAVLVSGQKLFLSGTTMANNQLDSNVVQTTMLKALPKTERVIWKNTVNSARAEDTGVSIFFEIDAAGEVGSLVIRQNETEITVNKVKDFSYSFERVGQKNDAEPTLETAKAQFIYTVVMEDDSVITGGVVLTNVRYRDVDDSLDDDEMSGSLKNGGALYFSPDVADAVT